MSDILTSYVHTLAEVKAVLYTKQTQSAVIELLLQELAADKMAFVHLDYDPVTDTIKIEYRAKDVTVVTVLTSGMYFIQAGGEYVAMEEDAFLDTYQEGTSAIPGVFADSCILTE